jgi:ATP/maltotriose-dependent transcriptional regulator MalT
MSSMTPRGDGPVASGLAALGRGDWTSARGHFAAALQQQETAEALEGLSEALWWLDDVAASFPPRRRAYALFRDSGEPCRAVRVALWLARTYIGAYGNVAVANGWLKRAERLVEDAGDCAERGWLEQLRSKMAPQAEAAADHAARAVDIARRHNDTDLEVWALSEQGRALVSMGRVDEGMAMLDEAVATATAGEARSLMVVGDTCCNMISACDRAADFERAIQWCEVVDDFTRRHHCVPIFHYCRVVYSGVLMARGRWEEAEAELQNATRAVQQGHPAQTSHSRSRLALLRVRQGRLEEAAELLAGLDNQRAAAEPLAALHLARGEAALAAVLVERRLQANGADDLVSAPLLGLLVEAKLAMGDGLSARAAAARLSAVAERCGRPAVHAAALFAQARVELDAGSLTGATTGLEKASAIFEDLGMPFEAAGARLEWARALAASAPEVAVRDGRQAQAAFERLGARLLADRAAALLRDLGAGSRPGPRVAGALTRREEEVLALVSHGLSNDEIGTRLFISAKTVEHHVGRILAKLSLRRRSEAVAWALRHPPSPPTAK